MKKVYFVLFILSSLAASAQERPDNERFRILLGLSLNYTTTGSTHTDTYYNNPISTCIFPEFHAVGDILLSKTNHDVFIRVEATGTTNFIRYTLRGDNGYTAYSSDYKITEAIIGINPQLLYRFGQIKHGKLYGAVGLGGFIHASENNSTQFASILGAPIYQAGTNYDTSSWYTANYTVKLGYIVNGEFDWNISFSKPFEAGTSETTLFNFYTPAQTTDQKIFKLGLNYRIPKKVKQKPSTLINDKY